MSFLLTFWGFLSTFVSPCPSHASRSGSLSISLREKALLPLRKGNRPPPQMVSYSLFSFVITHTCGDLSPVRRSGSLSQGLVPTEHMVARPTTHAVHNREC